jgi:hypothetical protein
VCAENFIRFDCVRESHNVGAYGCATLLLSLLASPFKSNSRLEAENAALRHQLMVLQRKVRGRVHFTISSANTLARQRGASGSRYSLGRYIN